ncbi:hypothetical protein [Halobacterium wangiae]|uniref:hypothetical protein n=1 Tax=Halobacterium wangiae TaxID=2902623 RepID=UPI001E42B45D|nr:hypothetical protein [Halobacterium wangiae]
MDDAALQHRLSGIERRQRLILVLLVVPYLVGFAYLVGVWVAGALYTVVGLLLFAAAVVLRRRRPDTTAQ